MSNFTTVSSPSGNSDSMGQNQIHMSNTSFLRLSITIKKGESVELLADTSASHTIANGTWKNGKCRQSIESGAPFWVIVVCG